VDAQGFWAGQAPGRATDGIQLEAMNFFSDTQETASRFGEYIDDFHDVFRCHDVDFGAPEDFFGFARRLKYHSELCGDVLRVVKSLMESGRNVSFRTILTVIAVASGGSDVALSEREMSVPVRQVIESLIGAGAWSQLNADHPGLYPDVKVKETKPAPALETYSPDERVAGESEGNAVVPILLAEEFSSVGVEAVENAKASGHADVGVGFPEKAGHDLSVDSSVCSAIDEGLPSSRVGYDGRSSERQVMLNEFGGTGTLAESLARLELNSLQLKIYLDSIDQRIGRIEPRLEKVAPLVPLTPSVHAREESGARFSAAIASEKEFQPSHNDELVSNQQSRAATAGSEGSGPLAVPARPGTDSGQFKPGQFHSGRRQIGLAIFVGVAMLLLAASLFWRFGHDTGYVVIQPANAPAEGGASPPARPSVAPGVAASVSGAQIAPVGEPSVAGAGGVQGKNSASSGTSQRGAADKPSPSSKKPAEIPLRYPLRSSPSVNTPVMAKDAAEVADLSDGADDLSSVPSSNRPVNVSSGVMAANLVSAPQPSYPKLASLTRTQGNVVMEAVISKDGTVEQLHVIKGHRLLRGAAKNAVRNWRYRPYKVGGVAVDVATTVSVDFNLNH
jgi:TonB family protein